MMTELRSIPLRPFLQMLFVVLCFGYSSAVAQDRAAWMKEARWGVMTHFLAEWIAPEANRSVDAWNELIDGFDVEGLAEQLESVGANYYLITLGQNSGFYLSPNATYDRNGGNEPSKCSRRDLVADLYEALQKRGIRLMVYLPAGAPGRDKLARSKLEWRNGPFPNREFQAKWEQVIREWSKRWGDKVVGWWFDGCYWPNTMYRSPKPPNFASFAAAARSGNPNSIVCFNPGVVNRTISITPHEDYIAGEISQPELMSIRRVEDGNVDGAQLHILSYLGERWGLGSPRFSEDQIINWSRQVVEAGGAITWDVPIQPGGLLTEPFVRQLAAVGKALEAR
jgi:alpha-L-fucosidase-like protein